MKILLTGASVLFSLTFVCVAQQAPVQTAEPVDERLDAHAVEPGGSLVRMVRLSDIRAKVLLDRNTGSGFEPTIANMPIVQGNRLKTAEGWAEVEFEDNSTLRITPRTMIEFPTLSRLSTGDTTSAITLKQGTLYVSMAKNKGTNVVVRLADKVVTLAPGCHIRVDVYAAGSEVYVIHGAVQVTDQAGTVAVEKGRGLKFGGPEDAGAVVAKDSTPGLYDRWDQTAVDYHNVKSAFAGSSPYAYGAQDLSYYGQFTDLAGCGQVWQPYFVSAAWDPFANGVWAYYPGSGYSFVSPYPWAWLPFHSGEWASCGGAGWGWRPNGQWTGVKNVSIFKPIKGPHPIHPITPPARGALTLVAVGKGLPYSQLGRGGRFEFVKDSAGFGVPRETFGHLGKISSQVAEHGTASREVIATNLDPAGGVGAGAPVARGNGLARASGAGLGGGSLGGRPVSAPEGRPVAVSGATGARGGGYSGGGYSGGSSGGSSSGSSHATSTASSSSSGSSAGSSSAGHH